MANTYILIQSTTVGVGGAASVSFNSIPQGYSDLLIKVSAKNTASLSTNGQYWLLLQLNSLSSIGTTRNIWAYSTNVAADTAGSGAYTKVGWITDNRTSSLNTFSNSDIYISNYTSTTNNKVILSNTASETNDVYGWLDMSSALMSTTAAVTSLTLYPEANNFAQYSTFYLYGIKNT